MPCYRTYRFPDLKWFLAMGARRFTNAPTNHFKAMFIISINFIAPFLNNAPVESHNHLLKNLTSRLPPGRVV